MNKTAFFHLPGLFEFFPLYRIFIPFYFEHPDYFYDWCKIGSIYGAPENCLWGGGREGIGEWDTFEILELLDKYNISGRLTFSNSLLEEKHLSDIKCNNLCKAFSANGKNKHGVIVHSDLLAHYLMKNFPDLYLVSSTTKVLTVFSDLQNELHRKEFSFVVPDFRLNKDFINLEKLTAADKIKMELLCNECCWIDCKDRKCCYENVSHKILDQNYPDHICKAPGGNNGYSFFIAMQNPAFISVHDIETKYLPMGIANFKIEGRGLGSAMVLEFLLYYMTKPEYQIALREALYLDCMLDLF